MVRIITFVERFGLFLILLYCFQLLPPDLTPKMQIMDLDLDVFNTSQAGANFTKQLFWITISFVYLVSHARNGVTILSKKTIELIAATGALILIGLISILWSESPIHTIKRLVFQGLLLFSVYSAVIFSMRHGTFVKCIQWTIYASVIVGTICLLMGNSFNLGGFSGWVRTKNTFGAFVLALFLLLYLKAKIEGSFNNESRLIVLVLASFLILSGSKTALLLSMIFAITSYLRRSHNRLLFLFSVCGMVMIYIILPSSASFLGGTWDIAVYLDDDAITGRGLIWRTLYDDLYYFDRIATGYGYGAYFGTGEIPYFLDDSFSFMRSLNSAHNSYIGLLLQLGFFLTVCVFLIISRVVLVTDRVFSYVIATIICLYGFSESVILRDQHIMWVIFILSLSLGTYMKTDLTKTQTPI